MKNIFGKNLLKAKLLYFTIILLSFTMGYSLGRPTLKQKYKKQLTKYPSKIIQTKHSVKNEVRLVVKRNARKVYIYQKEKILANFSIAIGKVGWETPLGNYQVIYMQKEPIFRNFNTGQIIKPGSINPLGKRLIVFKKGKKFDLAFHGTNQDKLIGQAVSHGCIRMRNQDVIALYKMVNIGTSVSILP